MDDYGDVYYVDTRNADSRDHRPSGSSRAPAAGGGWRPSAPPPPPVTTVYVPPTAQPAVYPPTMYPPTMYPPNFYPQQPSVAASLFGRLTAGQAVEIVAQIFAALQGLPAAPVATRNADTDVANHILYQAALAQHAKRDEQVRTIGALVAKLVG